MKASALSNIYLKGKLLRIGKCVLLIEIYLQKILMR